jgi:hypothetical protein
LLDKITFSDIHEQKGILISPFPLKTLKNIEVFSLPGNALGLLEKRESHDSDLAKTTDGGSER